MRVTKRTRDWKVTKRKSPNLYWLHLVIPILGVVPVETFLVELDDNLWNLYICFFGRNQIGLIWPWKQNKDLIKITQNIEIVKSTFPLNEEKQLPRVIGSSNDSFSSQPPCKPSWFVIILFLFLLLLRLLFLSCNFWLSLFPFGSSCFGLLIYNLIKKNPLLWSTPWTQLTQTRVQGDYEPWKMVKGCLLK